MAEKIGFENGRNANFQGLVTLTLTLDPAIRHTVVHHSSTCTYIPNFTQIEETFCGRTDVRTYGRTDVFPPILLGRLLEVDLKSTRGVHFTILPESPCAAEFYKIWHTRSADRRNHICQIFSQSVQGLWSSDTPKIPISRWLAASPLQQCTHCRATLWYRMFGNLDWPINASRGMSAIAEFLLYVNWHYASNNDK